MFIYVIFLGVLLQRPDLCPSAVFCPVRPVIGGLSSPLSALIPPPVLHDQSPASNHGTVLFSLWFIINSGLLNSLTVRLTPEI